jgi:hypothetical protein
MRSSHVIGLVLVLLIGLGVKMLFFPAPSAEAQSQVPAGPSMDILKMHFDHPNITDLPEQSVKEPF